MLEEAGSGGVTVRQEDKRSSWSPVPGPRSLLFCNVCSHSWRDGASDRRFRSIDELIRVTGMRRDEVTVLAEIGALNALGYDRRSALWQVERIVRPAGELFADQEDGEEHTQADQGSGIRDRGPGTEDGVSADRADQFSGVVGSKEIEVDATSVDSSTLVPGPRSLVPASVSPLPEMSAGERLVADYAGTGITAGPHPMGFRRHELATKGVLRAIDLPQVRNGRRVRTAGMVITRQRPGTAKGFVFLTLEDETGIANIIVRPDVYARDRAIVVDSPFLLVEGILQVQDGVTAIKAERMERLEGLLASMAVESHDFH
jgi:DNA polymerase III alpha subunit